MDCDDGPPPPPPLPYRVKAYHPFSIMRNWEKTTTCFSEDDKIDMCLEYLADIPFDTNCKVLKKRRGQTHQSCNCLQILKDEIAQEAVAKFMNYFYKKTKIDRQLLVMDWIRYVGPDNNSKAMYYLPFFNDSDSIYSDDDREETIQNLSSHLVCRSALKVILDFGYTQWLTCQKHVQACTTPTHGLCERRSNNGGLFDRCVKDDLFLFFEEQKMLATPQATRVVRELVGTGLRGGGDGADAILELPPSFSKRGMYSRFVEHRGYEIFTDARGTIKAKQSTAESLATQPICSVTTFRNFWQKHFPELRLTVSFESSTLTTTWYNLTCLFCAFFPYFIVCFIIESVRRRLYNMQRAPQQISLCFT